MKGLFVICLRYAPGNWQHMNSLASCMKENGWGVNFIISSKFKWMNEEFADKTHYPTSSKSPLGTLRDIFLFFTYKWVILYNIIQKQKPEAVVFVMWHPLNYFLAKIIRKISPHTKITVWLHEPCKVDKSFYKEKAIAYKIIEYIQQMLLWTTDIVILHSARALAAFKYRYPHYKNDVKVIPLLFKDSAGHNLSGSRTFDITFVGTAAKSKGIDDFFELFRKNQELDLGLKLQIVTSSNISVYLNKLNCENNKFLRIINKPNLFDEEIREACTNSFAVCAFYKEITQSGVVPVAFMCGTPVIGTNIEGLNESIVDKINGVLLAKDFSHEDVISALAYVKENFPELSKNARECYEKTWSEKKFEKHYGWLLNVSASIS
jgi:glycosyltransferase involved in cell wall biosynthesis